MNRFKEKLTAIWHILFDKEYIVVTVTVKDKKRVSDCMVVSDNISRGTIGATIKVLRNIKGVEYK